MVDKHGFVNIILDAVRPDLDSDDTLSNCGANHPSQLQWNTHVLYDSPAERSLGLRLRFRIRFCHSAFLASQTMNKKVCVGRSDVGGETEVMYTTEPLQRAQQFSEVRERCAKEPVKLTK